MKKLYITGDFNDADYGNALIVVEDSVFEKFKPLIEAINNFEPYIRRSSSAWIDYHNWENYREDLGEISIYEKYPQFSESYIEEFREIFISPIPVHNQGAEDSEPHTIVSLIDVITDEVYIDTSDLHQRHNDKVKAYLDEVEEIYSYHRKSDGKCIHSIPYSEMTDEENALIERKRNLWKKYI